MLVLLERGKVNICQQKNCIIFKIRLYSLIIEIQCWKSGFSRYRIRKFTMAKFEGINNMISLKSSEERVSSLKKLLESENLEFSSDADWEALVNHIEVHKYFINQKSEQAISWDEAVSSWIKNVYAPLEEVIVWWEVKKAFKKYTKGQLLFAVSSHWYYLREKDPEVTPSEAANQFAAKYGKGIGRYFSQKKLEPVLHYV